MQFFILAVFCLVAKLAQPEFFYIPNADEKINLGASTNVLPWLGILRVKCQAYTTDAVTGIILIAKRYAIGNSNHISKIDRRTMKNRTTAIFFKNNNIPWASFMEDYFLHPEFDGRTTINTIALLKLDTKHNVPEFMWQPIRWPKRFYYEEKHDSIYSMEFTDRRKYFEQVIHRMEDVPKETCKIFYKKEELDFKIMWPTHWQCFKTKDGLDTCLYDAGMAIASNASGSWTLIGLSTYGPGCGLPSRFIEFFPYIPWIRSKVNKHYPEKTHYTRRYDWMKEPGEDHDKELFLHFDNDSIKLHLNMSNINETLLADTCSNETYIIYAEKGYFNVRNMFKPATVFYSVSLWDDAYENYTCIETKVKSLLKSKTEVFFKEGFGQEDIEPLIKQVSKPKQDGTLGDTVVYLKDTYKRFRKANTITIWFKFELYENAYIDIKFYGKPKEYPTTTEGSFGSVCEFPLPICTKRETPLLQGTGKERENVALFLVAGFPAVTEPTTRSPRKYSTYLRKRRLHY